jgi:DNA-binding transcriptional ArsR family regulator
VRRLHSSRGSADQIAEAVRLPQPAAREHLEALRGARLVEHDPNGTSASYVASRDRLADAFVLLGCLLAEPVDLPAGSPRAPE